MGITSLSGGMLVSICYKHVANIATILELHVLFKLSAEENFFSGRQLLAGSLGGRKSDLRRVVKAFVSSATN